MRIFTGSVAGAVLLALWQPLSMERAAPASQGYERAALYSSDSAPSETGAVRGMLFRPGQPTSQRPDGRYPAGGIQLTLFNQRMGRSSPAYSGSDGMYYFYNVPAGDYTLEVWLAVQQATPYGIRVLPSTPQRPFTDIAPIAVR